jgi:DNA-binding transcriptional MerR regulator
MRELERVSGVSRETIRYYIREGLLPEPVRTSRNSALYDEAHLLRLFAIKRLQGDRYLPLSVIRSLLEESDRAGRAPADVVRHVDRLLHARLDSDSVREPAEAVAAEFTEEAGHLAECVESGLVEVAADGSVSARDARILRLLNRLAALGFTRQSGYAGDITARYVELMRWLAREEVRDFLANTAASEGEGTAAEMAAGAVPLLNELLAELHIREILNALADPALSERGSANDNASGPATDR